MYIYKYVYVYTCKLDIWGVCVIIKLNGILINQALNIVYN